MKGFGTRDTDLVGGNSCYENFTLDSFDSCSAGYLVPYPKLDLFDLLIIIYRFVWLLLALKIDLADIRSAYQQLYGTSLEQAIASDCSGAYKDGLIAIVKGFYH
uniref:Uncharacterized protein n=1 Tax=Meloidogyne enterolobii TaxID=390850 RepID=A0A6V7Y967_MELEN|nr:unnamed protein product [Meloidogyne enterolobii]